MSLLILNKLEYRLRYVKYPIPNYARAATKKLEIVVRYKIRLERKL